MQRVEIRIKSHLDKNWTEWLDGFALTHTEQDETLLTGMIKDQAALYGLIAKLRDLGVVLRAVNLKATEEDSLEENDHTDGSAGGDCDMEAGIGDQQIDSR